MILILNILVVNYNEKLDDIPSRCIVLMVHEVKNHQYSTHWRLNRRDGV